MPRCSGEHGAAPVRPPLRLCRVRPNNARLPHLSGGGPSLGAHLRQLAPSSRGGPVLPSCLRGEIGAMAPASSRGGLFLHSVFTSPRGQTRRRQLNGRCQHNTTASTDCCSSRTRTREAYRRALGAGLQGYLAIRNRHPVGPYSRTMPRLLWRS